MTADRIRNTKVGGPRSPGGPDPLSQVIEGLAAEIANLQRASTRGLPNGFAWRVDQSTGNLYLVDTVRGRRTSVADFQWENI